MKKLFTLIFAASLFAACGDASGDTKEETTQTDDDKAKAEAEAKAKAEAEAKAKDEA